MSSPTFDHWAAVEHILCYLKGASVVFYTVIMGIIEFTDADWAGSKKDIRSTSSYCMYVCWRESSFMEE